MTEFDVSRHLNNTEVTIEYLIAIIEGAIEDEALDRNVLIALLADLAKACQQNKLTA